MNEVTTITLIRKSTYKDTKTHTCKNSIILTFQKILPISIWQVTHIRELQINRPYQNNTFNAKIL